MNHHNHDIDIVIFHGDDTSFPGNGQIAITIDTELDLTGMSAHFQLCNFVQTFPVIPEDKTLLINIPASYTEKFPVGCTFAKVWLLDATGLKRTLANTLSVLVTNRVDLAYATDTTQSVTVSVKGIVTWESIQGKPNVVLSVNGTEPDENGNVEVEAGLPECTIRDIPEEFTEDEMRLKLNEIINWCKGGTAMIAAILSLAALGEPTVNLTIETAQKGKILNTANIVTDVSATLSGMEDLASVETVSNIVEGYGFATTSITNGLRGYGDLSYNISEVTSNCWVVITNENTHEIGIVLTNLNSQTYVNLPPNPAPGDGGWILNLHEDVSRIEKMVFVNGEWSVAFDGNSAPLAEGQTILDFYIGFVFQLTLEKYDEYETGTSDTIALESEVDERIANSEQDMVSMISATTNKFLRIDGGGTVTGMVKIVSTDAGTGVDTDIIPLLYLESHHNPSSPFCLGTYDYFAGTYYGLTVEAYLRAWQFHVESWNDIVCDTFDMDSPFQKLPEYITECLSTYAPLSALESSTNAIAVAKQDALPYPTNAIPYTALIDTPTIPTVPTQVSAFNNDAGYVNAEIATNIAESAIASSDTAYRLTVGVTNLNQSVQYVALDDTTTELAIALPTGDGAKDWLVYVNAATNTTLILPAATWWMSDEAFTNALPAGLTALYFSQISTNGVYSLGRQEMTPITIAP